jgi:hypothetical protein
MVQNFHPPYNPKGIPNKTTSPPDTAWIMLQDGVTGEIMSAQLKSLGLGVPSWVSALKSPSGDVPTIAADFQNGQYWAGGRSATLADVVTNNANFNPWNPASVITGLGVVCATTANPVNNNGAILLPPSLHDGLTYFTKVISNGSPPINNPSWNGSAGWTTVYADFDTGNTTSFQCADTISSSGTAVHSSLQPQALNPILGNAFASSVYLPLASAVSRMALTYRFEPGLFAVSSEGNPVSVADQPPFGMGAFAPNYLGFQCNDYGGGNLSYLSLLAIYPVQPDSDLQTICRF